MSATDFPPELSLSRCREMLKNGEFVSVHVVRLLCAHDIDRELLDILQWSLFIRVAAGLPSKFAPMLAMPVALSKRISDPVGPDQFIADRYVAHCDAHIKNSGPGIAASEGLIEYTLGSVADGVFDLCAAFQGSIKVGSLSLQLVCLAQGLSFCDVYRKLVISSGSGGHGQDMAWSDNMAVESNLAVQCLARYHIWCKKRSCRFRTRYTACSRTSW